MNPQADDRPATHADIGALVTLVEGRSWELVDRKP
jgi:hypothetical protein